MGSRIYTRRGDQGHTSLVDDSRVRKDTARVRAYGTVDEANSWIGLARSCQSDPLLDGCLEFAQHRFFNCSSNLATPPSSGIEPPRIAQPDIDFLERAIDRFENTTGPLAHFILPGGCACAGFLHVARTVCRRAERLLVTLSATEHVDPLVQKFVNRASDFLFAAARYANAVSGRSDVAWDTERTPPRDV